MSALDDQEEERLRLLQETAPEGYAEVVPSDLTPEAEAMPAVAEVPPAAPAAPEVPKVPEIPAAKPLTPAQLQIQKLVEAIRAPKAPTQEPQSDEARRHAQAAQAFYAMSQHSKLPDTFFAPMPPKDSNADIRRDLIMAQTAKALAGLEGKPHAQLNPEDVASTVAYIESLPEERANRQQKDALIAKAKVNPKEARLMGNSLMSNVGRVSTQKQQEEQFQQQFANKKEQQQLAQGALAEKSGEHAAKLIGKDAVNMISAADTVDQLSGGALSAMKVTPELDKALGAPHRINLYAKRLPEFAGSLVGKAQDLYDQLIGSGKTPEQAHAELTKNPDTGLAAMDSALELFYLTKQHELAGSAVTQVEKDFVNNLFNRQMGASPAEQLMGLRVMMKALDANVNNAYATMKARGESNPAYAKFYESLSKMPGAITPEHPFLKRMRGPIATSAEAPAPTPTPVEEKPLPPGYKRAKVKGQPGIYNPTTHDFLPD